MLSTMFTKCSFLGQIILVFLVLFTDQIRAQSYGPKDADLKIIGTQKTFPYTKFTGIDKEKRPLLHSIYLELVEFEPDYLVSQLEGCTNLEYLTLRDTHWKQRTFTQKVDLPNLFSFELYLKNWDYTKSSTEEILSFYFVYKSTAGNYNASSFVPSLGISSGIYVLTTNRKVNLINSDSDRQVLEISHLPFDVSPYFEFDFLELKNTVLNVSRLREIKRSLEMEDVKLTNGGMSEIFAKSEDAFSLKFDFQEFTELETIDIAHLPLAVDVFGVTNAFLWTSVPGLTRNSLINLKLKRCDFNATNFPAHPDMEYLELSKINFIEGDLSFLRRYSRLQVLRIDWMSNFDLSISSTSRRTLMQLEFSHTTLIQSSAFEFSRLATLVLNNSRMDSNALNNFSKTFMNIEDLEIYGDFEYLSSILLESLKTSAKNIRISLRGDQRIRSDTKFKEVNEFLQNSSVPPFATTIWLYLSVSYLNNQKTYTWQSKGYSEHYTQNPYLRNLAIYSYTIPLFIICFVGIIGNLMSAIILLTKEMRSSTSCILLGLTLCDSTILSTYILSVLYFGLKFIFMFWKFSIPELEFPLFWFQISLGSAQHMENLHSLFIYPLNKTAYTGSVYMTILVTMERYVAVCWPLRSKRILTMKKAIFGTLFVLAASIVLNIPRWLEAQTNTLEESEPFWRNREAIGWKINRNTAATDLLLYTNYRTFYHGWIWVILMYGIPVPVLIGLNLKIWIQLKRRISNKDALTMSRSTRNEEELASLTRVLLCVATVFIICNIINGVVTLAILWNNPGDWEPADIEIFSCIPLIINSSVNFIIYCLMGKKFRGILIKMLRKYSILNYWNVSMHCKSCNRNRANVTPEVIQNSDASRL